PLLGAEVVVQQPARDAGVARDVVERRARDAALRDRRAHRVDDALRLLPAELRAGGRGGFHAADSSWPASLKPAARKRAPRRAPVAMAEALVRATPRCC